MNRCFLIIDFRILLLSNADDSRLLLRDKPCQSTSYVLDHSFFLFIQVKIWVENAFKCPAALSVESICVYSSTRELRQFPRRDDDGGPARSGPGQLLTKVFSPNHVFTRGGLEWSPASDGTQGPLIAAYTTSYPSTTHASRLRKGGGLLSPSDHHTKQSSRAPPQFTNGAVSATLLRRGLRRRRQRHLPFP